MGKHLVAHYVTITLFDVTIFLVLKASSPYRRSKQQLLARNGAGPEKLSQLQGLEWTEVTKANFLLSSDFGSVPDVCNNIYIYIYI